MKSNRSIRTGLAWAGLILLQLIATQLTTLLASFVWGSEDFPQTHPVQFVIFLGITFSAGVFLVGWLALLRGWQGQKPKTLSRLAGALLGAYIPLVLGLVLSGPLQPGSPFFTLAILLSILGFWIPGWLDQEMAMRSRSNLSP